MTSPITAPLWSDLEMEVAADMIEHGYDPYDHADITSYWKALLDA